MATKRANDTAMTSLVPVTKKTKNEIQAYTGNTEEQEGPRTSLFAPIVLLTGHEGEIFCVKFSPKENILASAGYDRKVLLWSVEGECDNWATLAGHSGAILDLKFSNDGTEVVTCSSDKSIQIWDLQTLERVKRYKGHKNVVNSIDTSRKQYQLVCSASDDNMVKLWDRRKKGEAMNFECSVQAVCVSFNDESDQIISGGIDDSLKVWDLRKSGLAFEMKGHKDTPTGLALSPCGSYVASNAMDNTVKVWDVRPYATSDRCVKTLHGHSHNFEKNLLRVAWSPAGDLVSAGSADKFLYIWDFESGKINYKLPGHNGSINDVAFHPSEEIIASASSDKKIYLGEI